MVGIAEAAQLATFLKTASDITKSAVGLSNAEAIRSKVIELQGVILSAQSSAMAAQSDQFTLLERVRALESQIANLEAWEAKKQRYELNERVPGVYAYRLKPNVQPTEPPHYICETCYKALPPSCKRKCKARSKCNSVRAAKPKFGLPSKRSTLLL